MPHDRSDFLQGQATAVLANIHRAKDAEVFEPGDFLPRLRDENPDDETETPDAVEDDALAQVEANANALKALLGKKG